MSQQPVINGLEFARRGEAISGSIPLVELPRVQELVADGTGEIHYRISGKLNDDGKAFLHIIVEGSLPLICQRCLKGMDYPLEIDAELELIADEAELDSRAEDPEAADAVVTDKKMEVVSLVEEEILLEIPLSPKHSEGGCVLPGSSGKDGKENPFGVLATLKQRNTNEE